MKQPMPSSAGRFILLALLLARPAASQSLGLTPAEIRATFKPQQVLQFDLSVSNDGDTAVPMRGSVTDLWFDAKTNEKVFGAPGTLPRSAANWMTFVPSTFTVPPHGTATVKLVITPPADAAGGSYAVLFVESKPELARGVTPEGRPILANMRLGALVLLEAEGTEDFRLEVRDASLTPPAKNQNLELSLQLSNQGNVHLFPRPQLIVMNASKKVVARAEGDIRRFFPGQTDTVKVTWPGSLPPGEYQTLVTISYGKDRVFTEELPLRVEAE